MLQDQRPDPAEAARDYFSGFLTDPNKAKSRIAKNMVAGIEAWMAGGHSQPSKPSVVQEAPVLVIPKDTLDKAAEKLKWTSRNPQSLWEFYDAFYAFHFQGILGPRDRMIPDCPYPEHLIEQWIKVDHPYKLPFILPAALSGIDALEHITRAFPTVLTETDLDPVGGLANESGILGWMSIEAAIDAPHRVDGLGNITGLDEDSLTKLFDRLGRRGQTVNVYALSGQVLVSMWGWGRYPDSNGTDTRLLGTRLADRALAGHFDTKTGRMALDFHLRKNQRGAHLGGRSAGDLATTSTQRG